MPRTSCSTGILRDEWGFDGIVASDYVGLQMLSTQHKVTNDPAVAAAYGLRAGVDAELPSTAVYGEPLLRALADGLVDESLVDATVERALRMKFRLGLFEHPFIEPPSAELLAALADEEARVARELAVRSLVLVENDGVLPLRKDVASVAVIGPIADSARELLGDYAHLLHIETLLEMRHNGNAFGFPLTDEIVPADELAGRRTILDEIDARLPGADVRHARGTGIHDGTDAEIAAGRRAGPGIGRGDRRPGRAIRPDRQLRRPGSFAIVSISGSWVASRSCWRRSSRPGRRSCSSWSAAGRSRSSGPPVTVRRSCSPGSPAKPVPRPSWRRSSATRIPAASCRSPCPGASARCRSPTATIRPVDGRTQRATTSTVPTSPLWPFGFGRSYTTFELSDLRLDRTQVATDGGEITVTADVTNTGNRRGDEVVQLYVRDPEATVARPVLELRGFRRVGLAPGECRSVSFRLSAEQFAYVGADYRRVVEPGVIKVFVGSSSNDLPLGAQFELVGPTIQLVERHRYLTETALG